MRMTYWFARIAGLALAAVGWFTPAANAEIVISNERPVATTFVVRKANVSVSCKSAPCAASMFKPTHLTCPAAIVGPQVRV
jgi:hypothetical protein